MGGAGHPPILIQVAEPGESSEKRLACEELLAEALSDYDVQYTTPTGTLISFTIVAISAGVIAAVGPARRAARLKVLEALQYE